MIDNKDTKLDKITNILSGFGYLSIYRQMGILIGLAASIALGVALALWASAPDLRPLFTQLEPEDIQQISDTLEKKNIHYQLDGPNAAILVPADEVYKLRVMMASEGLPKGSNSGYGILKESSNLIGNSQFIERARYIHALETELSKTIKSIKNIKNARVHLAIPKPSVFLQDDEQGSASIFVELVGNQTLSTDQVASIVYLVSSSVPHMDTQKITVVDQQGRLLSDQYGDDKISAANKQFRQTVQVEQMISKKIEELLIPLYGPGRVRARVSADLDFTHTEQTKEIYNPDTTAIRSEQVLNEIHNNGAPPEGGIPGALSNQPNTVNNTSINQENNVNNQSKNQITKNYEIDKTISHIQNSFGKIEKLSIAVIIDDKTKIDQNGQVTHAALAPEEIQKVTNLVKEAVGYNPQRGDKVTVMNSSFAGNETTETTPEANVIFQNPLFWLIVKYALGLLGIIMVSLGVLKPFLLQLVGRGKNINQLLSKEMSGLTGKTTIIDPKTGQAIVVPNNTMGHSHLSTDPSLSHLGSAMSYQDQMKLVREMAKDDPKRVAQVVRKWVESD